MTQELLQGLTALLLAVLCWVFRAWWSGHKDQHARLEQSIERLDTVYATKTSVQRAHDRLDDMSEVITDHEKRLTQLETEAQIRGAHVRLKR